MKKFILLTILAVAAVFFCVTCDNNSGDAGDEAEKFNRKFNGTGVDDEPPPPVITYTLAVGRNNAGGGSVSRAPSKTAYNAGEPVMVTAAPSDGYVFSGWTGSVESAVSPLLITMDDNKSLTAIFVWQGDEPPPERVAYELTIGINPAEGGYVSRDPDYTDYEAGTQVTITAVPGNNYKFKTWDGDAATANAEITITMNGNKSLIAIFEQTQISTTKYTLAVSRNPTAGGNVTVNGGSNNPSQSTHNAGASITVAAAAANNYTFQNWTAVSGSLPSGVTTASPTITFSINSNVNIRANFQQVATPPEPADSCVPNPIPGCSGYEPPTVRQFAVSFNTVGGTPATIRWVSVDSGTAIGTSNFPSAPTKADYTFEGWFSGNIQYTAAAPAINGDVTLTAKWVSSSIVYGPSVPYGGETYPTVVIGGQTWFAKNLNYDVPDNTTDVCYNNADSNCTKYGRLYNWATAMNLPSSYNSSSASDANQIETPHHQGICPTGWHIPTSNEFTALTDSVGGSNIARKLMAQEGWDYCGPSGSNKSYVCDDTLGFAALPSGYGNSNGNFSYVGSYGGWWNATESGANYAGYRYVSSNRTYVDGYTYAKNTLYSVRCVQDD